ncbi:hypothetical protein AMTRI_Chr09g16860 [Amborella trichopoda]
MGRDTPKPNPNTRVGAMVPGPDKHDGFKDVRGNYNDTKPTLAGNSHSIDNNIIFSAVPPMFPTPPPSLAPWNLETEIEREI